MGQVCTRDDEVDKINDQPASPDSNQNIFKAAVPVYEPPKRDVAPEPAPQAQSPQDQSKLDDKAVDDLHLDARLLEPWSKMNTIHPLVQKRLDSLGSLVTSPQNHAELYKQYQAFAVGGSVVREKTSGSTYKGQMHRGLPHGWGQLVAADGAVTQGFFHEGKPTGFTIHIATSGQSYIGEMVDFAPHGKGTQTTPEGRVTECATWNKGQPEGKVVVKNANGTVILDGHLRGGKKNGQCVYYDEKTRSRYIGNFVNDLLEGPGRRVGDNAEVFEGEFKGGLENGKGVLVTVDGRKIAGNFQNGKVNGEVTLTTDAGKMVKQTWKDGKRV